MVTEMWSFWFAVSALMVSGLSPLAQGYFTRRAYRRDQARTEQRIRDEEAHRGEVAAEALKIAQELVAESRKLNAKTAENVNRVTGAVTSARVLENGVLTSTMERELEAMRAAIRAMQDAARVKEDAGLAVLPETNVSIQTMQMNARALETEIRKHKEAEQQ